MVNVIVFQSDESSLWGETLQDKHYKHLSKCPPIKISWL